MRSPIPIAIIANSQTPYRLHLHQRLVDELPQYEIWSLFTHEASNSPWRQRDVRSIRPVQFGEGESSADQDKVHRQLQEWLKGGRITTWMRAKSIRAVVLLGYNDMGRIRILAHCRKMGIPCYIFGDSNIKSEMVPTLKGRLKSLLLPLVFRFATGGMHCGRLGQEYFEFYGMKSCFPFPYEANYPLIQSMPLSEIDQLTTQFCLPRERKFLIYSGRLAPVKRVDLLADAFLKLASERPEWDLILVGDGPEREKLKQRFSLVSGSRVHWTGFVDDERTLAALYRKADVLVLPSDYEPWGVVVTEAAAAGLALVASSVVGAAADLVVPGRNGDLFIPGDSESLLNVLRDATNPEKTQKYKIASPQVLEEWRTKYDPVKGLCQALSAAGIS